MTGRFAPGDRVVVRRARPPGHVRTPWFVRGHEGVVVQALGAYANPEELAYGRPGMPRVSLYRVRFDQRGLWPDYAGAPEDTATVDLYDHWLEPAEAER